MAKNNYVFDISAWICYFEKENGYEIVKGLIDQAISHNFKIPSSFMTCMEIYYISIQDMGETLAIERSKLIKILPIEIIESNPDLAIQAARLKAKYRISLADSWIAALANDRKATLVHKDPEFELILEPLALLTLPYKSSLQ